MLWILPVIAAIYFLAMLWIDVHSDYHKWLSEIPVKHTKEAIIRVAFLSPTYILLAIPKMTPYFNLWNYLLTTLVVAGVIFSVWWELFDGFYNKIRGLKWRFNGSVDPDDSKLDKFLYGISDTWEGILKIGLIFLFLILYIAL